MLISSLYQTLRVCKNYFYFLKQKTESICRWNLNLDVTCKFELFFLELYKEETSYSFLNNYEGIGNST